MTGSIDRRRPKAILIAGPTASGKSALAVRLAERLGGTIVNADSMQVYRDLRILTARPDDSSMGRVPHALYGTIDGARAYSVDAWLSDVAAAIDQARVDNRLPIIVGGTGLYFSALTKGLSAIPVVPQAVRARLREWAAGRPPPDLHDFLAARDPVMAAKLRPTDPQRILRAIEVLEATGRSLASFHDTREPPLLDLAECAAIVLAPQRAALWQRTDDRFRAMIEDGGMEEVTALSRRCLPSDLPVMRALGVPPLLRALSNEIDAETAIAIAQRDTRNYVKRQMTFARSQLADFRSVAPEEAEATLSALSQSA